MRTRLLTAFVALALPAAALAQTQPDYDQYEPDREPTAPSWQQEQPPPPPVPAMPVTPEPAPVERAEQSNQAQPAPQPSQPSAVQPQQQVVVNAAPAPAVAEEAAPASTELERGVTVMGQAGVLTYTGEAAGVTRPGSTYGVAVGFDVVRGINAELGYLGASYRSEGGDNVGITENGGQALMKLGPQHRALHPFAMFGFAVSRVNALGDEGSSTVRDATHLKLPMGAGVSWTVPSEADAEITVGARAAYNFTLDAGAFPTLNEPAAANQLTGMAVVGGRF